MFEINHTNINITNIDQSLAFYKEALGLQEHHRKEDPEGNYVLVFLTDGHPDHAMIELTWLKGPPTPCLLYTSGHHSGAVCQLRRFAFLLFAPAQRPDSP